jgi:hypothetical protein
MYDHAEPMQAPNIAKFGRQILLALKALRSAGVPSMGGHLHTGNVLVSELAFPMSIGISGACFYVCQPAITHFLAQILRTSSLASLHLPAYFLTRA